MVDNNKANSFIRYRINYDRKSFYSTASMTKKKDVYNNDKLIKTKTKTKTKNLTLFRSIFIVRWIYIISLILQKYKILIYSNI
jgi:hypothetical protein